jgi:hypothetical protein
MKFFSNRIATPLGDTQYHNRHKKRNQSRVEAIMNNCPIGNRALDIGCNAGYFSKGLLSNGLAQFVDAIEYNADIVPDDLKTDKRFSLFEGDATSFSFAHQYDTTVYGAVHHHIFARHGYAMAMQFWNNIVDHTESTIFMESGQLAEGSRWYWQRALRRYYSSDEQYYGDLVYSVGSRLKSITVIGTHWIHGVRRWLLKIELYPTTSKESDLNLPLASSIEIRETLHRTIGSHNQKLISDKEKSDLQLYEGVSFSTGIINQNEEVFCKKYIATEKETFEAIIAHQINDERFIIPIATSHDSGLIFPFISAKKLNEIPLNEIQDKETFRDNIDALYEFAKAKDIYLDFAGDRSLKLIDIIDLHKSNIFFDEQSQNIYVFDLEFYSMANKTRNKLHLMRVLYQLDAKNISAILSLISALSSRLKWLLNMAVAKPETRILYRVENGFSWGYIRVREKIDKVIAFFVPSYRQ